MLAGKFPQMKLKLSCLEKHFVPTLAATPARSYANNTGKKPEYEAVAHGLLKTCV